jgi:hypothetical protein
MIATFCAIFITAIAAQTNHKRILKSFAKRRFQQFPDLGLSTKHYKKQKANGGASRRH